MIESIRNIFVIPDLRKRIIFTFFMLAIFRIGAHIPTPGVNWRVVQEYFEQHPGGLLGLWDMFSGGALRKITVFSLGIMPYISASIVLQLLTVVWPYLERLSKEGELGKKKITQYTRYGTVLLASIQALSVALILQRFELGNVKVVASPGVPFILMTILTMTTGTIFIMWLGEQISARGIGNGISLIIFAGIIVRFPGAVKDTVTDLLNGSLSIFKFLFLLIIMVGVTGIIVLVERAQRRIPISYAKRVMGRRMYGGQSTHLPLKINTGGVIPIIFAVAIVMLPQMAANFLKNVSWMEAVGRAVGPGQPLYNLLYIAAIIFFCYFYTAIIFNPIDVAENIRKYGGFIPGIRPGKRTAEYIDRILTRITFVGAIYLSAVAVMPELMSNGIKVQSIPFIGAWLDLNLPMWFTEGLGVKFVFGGTSLLIVVGVAIDTVQQIESQLIMRHYDGFLKKGRIRGRRY